MTSKNLKPYNSLTHGALSLPRTALLMSVCMAIFMVSGMTTFAHAESKLNLEETEIMGARELPKVLYIVPWKKTLPDSNPLPMHSLVDEALSPIDVDVFKRQVRYNEMIESSTGTGRN